MQGSSRLQRKYAFIRDEFFNDVEFSNPTLAEHPLPFVVPAGGSLAEFYRSNQIARFDIDEIVAVPPSPCQD